jgi:hypothetical protein
MNYRHINGTNRAFLYGSPSLNDDADIDIEVIAINKYNYETTKDVMKFRITKRESMLSFFFLLLIFLGLLTKRIVTDLSIKLT